MHPVVIMAYDKSPAITKAVAALEEAGMEVRVLNTNHAKLADFLGALAGEDDEDEDGETVAIPDEETPPKDEAPPEEAPAEDEEEPIATEALKVILDGEEIIVEVVDGSALELHPSGLMVGKKTAYAIGESHFSFWPASTDDLVNNVQIQFDDKHARYADVTIKEAVETPVLRIGRDWLKESFTLMEATMPRGWAILPATKVLYNKGSVSIEDIRKELGGNGSVLICARHTDSFGKGDGTKYPVFITSSGSGKEYLGKKSPAYHDQTFRSLGTFEVVGVIDLGKTAADDKHYGGKLMGKDGKETDAQSLKGPVFVFK